MPGTFLDPGDTAVNKIAQISVLWSSHSKGVHLPAKASSRILVEPISCSPFQPNRHPLFNWMNKMLADDYFFLFFFLCSLDPLKFTILILIPTLFQDWSLIKSLLCTIHWPSIFYRIKLEAWVPGPGIQGSPLPTFKMSSHDSETHPKLEAMLTYLQPLKSASTFHASLPWCIPFLLSFPLPPARSSSSLSFQSKYFLSQVLPSLSHMNWEFPLLCSWTI